MHASSTKMALSTPSWLSSFFSASIPLIAWFLVKLYLHRRFYKEVPAPPHSFFWGNLKLFRETMALFPRDVHYQAAVTTIAKKYDLPGAWYLDLWPFGPPHLIATDPDLAHQFTVLKHPKHAAAITAMDLVLGKDNIETAGGALWKQVHNMLAPAFSVSNQRNMATVMAEEVMKFRSILQEKSATGEVFRLEKVLQNLILNTIGRSIFDESLEAQTKEVPMLTAFRRACKENMILIYSWNPIAIFLARRKQIRFNHFLEGKLADMVRTRFEKVQRESIDVSQKRGLCTMDLILRDHLVEVRKTQKQPLDATFMRMAITQVKTLLLAGSGTTASTLTFAYALLSIHPEVLQKLRHEHDSLFCPGIEKTYAMLREDINRLSGLDYTTDFIKEVLRVFPIGNSARGEDLSGFITYNGRQLSTKGQLVTGVQHTMHYDDRTFQNASKFDPDRFARDEISLETRGDLLSADRGVALARRWQWNR